MSGSRWVITPSELWRWFLYSSSVYSCHLFLIASTFVRSIPYLSFIVPIFAWNIPLVSLIFLKRSLVSPILLFSSILCIDHWGSLSYISLLFFGTLHSNEYILPFLLSLAYLLFSAVWKASSDNHFAFLHFFFLGTVLIITMCTLWTSIRSSSDTLSDLILWMYFSPPPYNSKGYDLGHTLTA